MTAVRQGWRSGDGSAAIRGWTAFITLGLPTAMRDRRRDEVAADTRTTWDGDLDLVAAGDVFIV